MDLGCVLQPNTVEPPVLMGTAGSTDTRAALCEQFQNWREIGGETYDVTQQQRTDRSKMGSFFVVIAN
jgi:hypothetical protein